MTVLLHNFGSWNEQCTCLKMDFVYISFPFIRKPLFLEHDKKCWLLSQNSCETKIIKWHICWFIWYSLRIIHRYVHCKDTILGIQKWRFSLKCSRTNLTYISSYGLSFRNVLVALQFTRYRRHYFSGLSVVEEEGARELAASWRQLTTRSSS
jgi:hypothetical protein